MDEVHTRSDGNNDRRDLENRGEDNGGEEDDVAKGIIQRIRSRTGEDENENIEQVNMFPEGNLDVGNLEVPENDL
jgi:hypothetical protein